GGGGSKNPPSSSSPSTNIPSASSVPSSVASSSTSAISQLTIKDGVGASISRGEVVFTIGTQTAKAEIDSSSRYVAALEVSKENLDKPIIAIGSGKGADEWIQLAAVMPSTERLTELAGSDDTLDEYEYFGINLTALSTAEYAEIITNESPLTSDAERKSAIYGLHPTRAVEHAGMVMQLLTDIDTPLPTEVTTTLGYLLNSNLAETKLEILRIENEPLLKELVNNLQQDPTQTRVTGKKLSGKYFLESLHSQYFLTFNEEGSGVLVAKLLTSEIWNNEDGPIKSANFTWGRKGKLVEILLEQPLHYRSSVRTLNSNIDCDYSYTSEREL